MTPLERFQAFFRGEALDRPMAHPLCMKIASRVGGYPYRQYAQNWRVLGDCQIALAERYGVEVLSVCSDPARELADLGAKIVWFDDDPPMADPGKPIAEDPSRFLSKAAPNPDLPGRMQDRVQAVRYLKQQAGDRFPVQGWIEGPASFAAGARGLTQSIEDMLDDPALAQELFRYGTDLAIRFAQAQIEAGADLVGMGDAPASLLNPAMYRDLVLPEEKRAIQAIHDAGAIAKLHICGNTSHLLPLIGLAGADLVDLDSAVDLGEARAALPARMAILGNLDPVRAVRNSSPDKIREDLARCHAAVGERYVIGAGCEIPADTPLPNLAAFRECAVG